MMNKLIVFTSGLIGGVLITVIAVPVYRKFDFKTKEKILWKSSDQHKLETTAYDIIDYGFGIQTLARVFGENRYGPASAESQLVALKVLDECDFYTGGFLELGLAALSGRNATVRLTATEMYDDCLYTVSWRYLANLFVRQLHKETDGEVLSRKLDLLCKHLYMDRQEIENHLQQEGIEAVEDILWERLQELSRNEQESNLV